MPADQPEESEDLVMVVDEESEEVSSAIAGLIPMQFLALNRFSEPREVNGRHGSCRHQKAKGFVHGAAWGCEAPRPVEAKPCACRSRSKQEQ